MTDRSALLIGNTDGIGLATTRALLGRGWRVAGISRSPSPVTAPGYQHRVADVRDEAYRAELQAVLGAGPPELCIYCAGIGELLDLSDMEREAEIFEVNLLGLVRTVALVLPRMVEAGAGHLIGLSSVADAMLSEEAPSYHASKAGFSCYLESLALACQPRGVAITNLRFGFVDTKMAKGERRPFMMPVERAVEHVLSCIERRPIRCTAPAFVGPLVALRGWALSNRVRLGR